MKILPASLSLLFGFIWVMAAAQASDQLPHSTITRGTGDIRQVRLIDPTDRYQHCVLGDCLEAGGVEVTLADGTLKTYHVPAPDVFEDLVPRIVPLGMNSGEAILLVRAYTHSGGALALLEMVNGELVISAESPSIGTPNRWQNPVGVADFDGDGVLEIATVITPHIGGILTLYERKGDRLVLDQKIKGFSNHALGSTALGLSAMIDVSGDGILDIVLPGMSRRSITAVDFSSGRPVRLRTLKVSDPIDEDFVVTPQALLKLESGTINLTPLAQ